MRSSYVRALLHGCLLALVLAAGCATEEGGCPECPPVYLRDAAVACTPLSFACEDAGLSMQAEACTYEGDESAAYVRIGARTAPCVAGGRCDAALHRLGTDVCASRVSPCKTDPCRNGGRCTETASGFSCTCATGFTGARCEDDIHECAGAPCAAGMECLETYGSYVCRCPAGLAGAHCDQDRNECLELPCKNGGTCVNERGSFHCNCAYGYGGPTCEIDRRGCVGTPVECGARNAKSAQCAGDSGCATFTFCSNRVTCSSYFYSSSCLQAGCSWSSFGYCYGGVSVDCASFNDTQCLAHSTSCYSSAACTGFARPCSEFSLATCTMQSGCSIGVLP